MSLGVQVTSDDAAVSKLSAMTRGYIKDEFLPFFVRKAAKRSPLINRGYYARVAAIELLVQRFVAASTGASGECTRATRDTCSPLASTAAAADATGEGAGAVGGISAPLAKVAFGEPRPIRRQIVSLGAGLDTTFFKLKASGDNETVMYELDMVDVLRRKLSCIARHERLAAMVPDARCFDTEVACGLHSAHYHATSVDLRDVSAVEAALVASGVDFSAPTMFLSECVLVYMEPAESAGVIRWAASRFSCACFVTYEQIRPYDAFGRVMMRNLEERGCSLRSLEAFPDPASQVTRFTSLGWPACAVRDMDEIYYKQLPRSDVARIERLEMFDELEEWHLIQGHYCIVVAVNHASDAGRACSLASVLWSG